MMPQENFRTFKESLKDSNGNQIEINEGKFGCDESLLKGLPEMQLKFISVQSQTKRVVIPWQGYI